ncbi:hypothetical protein ACOSQ2_011836 [Xanthoceras sorbifolium]
MLNNPRPRSYRSKLISQNLGGLGAEYDPVVVTITARQENITLQKVQFLLISYGSILAQHNLLASIDLTYASANYNRIRGNNSRGGSREGRGLVAEVITITGLKTRSYVNSVAKEVIW